MWDFLQIRVKSVFIIVFSTGPQADGGSPASRPQRGEIEGTDLICVLKCSPSIHWPQKSQLTLQSKSRGVMETQHESQEMGVHFSRRNKDRRWCALKRLNHPSSEQPKPGEGWVMPFQKFRAVTFPCGTLASFALCPCTKGKELKVHVNVGPLFCFPHAVWPRRRRLWCQMPGVKSCLHLLPLSLASDSSRRMGMRPIF